MYSIVIVVLSLSMMFLLVFRNIRYRRMTGMRNRAVPFVLLSCSVLTVTGLVSGTITPIRLAAELWMTLFVLFTFTWQHVDFRYPFRLCIVCTIFQSLLVIHNLCVSFGFAEPFTDSIYEWLPVAECVASILIYLSAVWYGMRDIHTVMKSGTVWKNIEMAVSSVYMAFLLGFLACLTYVPPVVVIVMEAGMMVALCVRVAYDVQFVLMGRYETTIMESLKISQVEIANGVRPDTYKDLYDRVVGYFEEERPFLNSRLTINDVVKVVYSNKLYISRAISQYTGRNFCQFVNYYRVMYSVECFRKNPDLKVAALSEMSGFNSPVTFNLAFHLFMHENPSEWFRKERSRIKKR